MPSQNDSKKVKHNIIVRCEDFPEKKGTSYSWLVLTFLNKDDGHIRLLIMNNKSSCQRRRILPSVHSTDAVPYFSNHQVLFRTCPSRTSNLAKNHSYKEWENYIIVTDPVAQHTVQKLWDYSERCFCKSRPWKMLNRQKQRIKWKEVCLET